MAYIIIDRYPQHIYTLTDPRSGAVMYVGCTQDPAAREKQHRGANSRKPIGRWMDELAALGIEPVFAVVETYRSSDKALRREKQLIAEFKAKGQCQLNGKPGRLNRFEVRKYENDYTRKLAEL